MSNPPPLRSQYVTKSSSNSLGERDSAADLLASRSFYFAERYKEIDMDTITGVDLERIQRDVDIEALQQHLEVLTYGDIAKSVVKPLGLAPNDAAFIKLFRLAQLTIEYLLNVQDVLAEGLDRSSKKCKQAHERIERYKLKRKEHEAQISALKREIKTKRGAIHTYEAFVANARSRPPLRRKQHVSDDDDRPPLRRKQRVELSESDDDDDETPQPKHDVEVSEDDDDDETPPITFERSKSARAELTLYLSAPNGNCARHVVGFDTTAGELCTRLETTGGQRPLRLIHKGHELANDVVLATTGVKHGDTILVLSSGGSSTGGDGDFLDRRISELEASIRSEMAVQLQTQLSSLRTSVGDDTCFAGPLEDDNGDEPTASVRTPRFDDSLQQRPSVMSNDDTLGEIRAAEGRLCAQMEALESRMIALIDKLQGGRSPPRREERSPRLATPEKPKRLATPEPSPPKQQASPVAPSVKSRTTHEDEEEDLEPSATTWRCIVQAPNQAPAHAELQVQPFDTLADVRVALAEDLDVEPERLKFARAADGGALDDDDTALHTLGKCICTVVTAALVSDDQVADLATLKHTLGPISEMTLDEDGASRLEEAVSARQARWRQGTDALSQADVARLEVRMQALTKLVDIVDKCPGFDAAMVDRLKREFATVCDGLPPVVCNAITRVQLAVDERASLLAAKGACFH